MKPSAGRPAALNVSAALSFVTACALACLGMLLLSAVIAARSAFGSGFSSSGSASGVVALIVVCLGVAFLLFWGGLDVAVARSVTAAVVGNVLALLLAVIFSIDSSPLVLLFAVLPVVSILVLMAAGTWIRRERTH